MIITRRNGSLFLVDQNEHARLARDLCEHWGNDRFRPPSPREGTRLAAELHDEGWREADEEVRFNPDQGRPLHFLEIDIGDHIDFYRRGVEAALERDAYGALLVSMHWTGLYRSRWAAQDGAIFIQQDSPVAARQSEVVAAEERRWIDLKRPLLEGRRRSDFESELWHNYELLQVHDVLSLYLCTAVLRPGGEGDAALPVTATLRGIDQALGDRTIEAVPEHSGGDRVALRMTAVQENVVTVDPYPFDQPAISVVALARVIPDHHYESAEQVTAALGAGERAQITCELRRP
jgi:hypothetical protein